MNFREGLNYVYKNRSSDLELTDPFVLYCKLSDLCSSSFEDKHKVVLFYQIDKKIKVVESILNNDFDVSTKYLEVAELLSEESFNSLINTVKKVLDSNYIEKEKLPQKKASSKPVVQKAVVQKAEEAEEEESRTPLTNSYSHYGIDTEIAVIGWIIGGVILATIILTILGFMCNWSWATWQWLIGIIGGGILFVILASAIWWLNEEVVVDFYVLGTIILGICLAINFTLLLVFGANYKIIFSFMSVLAIVGGGILMYFTFDDMEDEWGCAQIIETILALILFIVALIWG